MITSKTRKIDPDHADYIAGNYRTALQFAKECEHNATARDYWLARAANRAAQYRAYTGKEIAG